MGAESFLTLQIADFAEGVDDRVAALLQAGTGITLTYNDGAGTLTIASSGGLGGSTGSNDNRILRADGSGGSTVQNSAVTIDDSGNISGLGTVNSEGQLTVRRVGGTAGTHEVQIYHDTNGGWVAERSSTRLNLVSGGSIIFGVNPGAPTNTGYGSISGSAFRVTSSIAIGWLSGSDPIGGSVDTALRRSSAGVVEINNGTAGQTRDLVCRAITASGNMTCQSGFQLASRTKAAVLASSTAVNSGRFQLSDAGLIGREVYPDGTNWRYASDDSIVT